ncbi:uncharacterized protein L203_102909 [Cryptococcus depauperatus CBS 7841]|uniref:Uncharacterized protein n=1 Tax=Cryptococcus depauperatus CBS 7841 TaxID=1295531 RepID=A0A1E3IB42_9TREE|nr:hypothetical protein L203_04713 [Cryptococcus depauperatus CBS 7841]ODO04016.1 hypothetical protein L204_00362 [Cryptococcus depauperatus CBS 7855]
MGFLDFLLCCGHRKDKDKNIDPTQDTATLLPPNRPDSIVSADSLTNYGATEQQGLTEEQRVRIAAIGRQVGSHMLPVSTSPNARTGSPRRLSASSVGSSRPPSPSPQRPDTTPPDGRLRTSVSTDTTRIFEEDGGEDVVRKNLFTGGNLGNGAKKKGKAKSKTKKAKSKGKK